MAETVAAAGYTLVAFVSQLPGESELLGLPVLPEVPTTHLADGGLIAVAIGDNASRERVWRAYAEQVPLTQLPAFIHPSADVAASAIIKPGASVLQGAIIGSHANVGIGCLVNSGAIVEHECTLGDFSSLAPGSTIGGRVTIGTRSAISIGAIVKHGLTVGSDTVVGSASYVHHDLPSGVIAYGSPARKIRDRSMGEPYLR